MKKSSLIIAVSSVVFAILVSACSSGAAHQSWQPKKGKKPKAGQNR